MSKAKDLLNATIVAEIFSTGLARWLIYSVVCFGMSMFFLFFVFGDDINSVVCLSFLSGPLLSAALWYYLGGYRARQALNGQITQDLLTIQSAGARKPSQREEQMLMPVLQQVIEAAGANVRSFNEIYVIDSPVEMVYTIGPYLIPSSSALRSRYLGAMLAHELGHIQNGDNNTVLALSDMMSKRSPAKRPTLAEMSTSAVVAPGTDVEALQKGISNTEKMLKLLRPQDAIFVVGFLNFFNTGGGVRRKGQEWAAYFREQDFKADIFAVECGYKQQLAEYLEQRRLIEGSIPDGLAWQAPSELRLERILNMESLF